jgi:hypothetical protein
LTCISTQKIIWKTIAITLPNTLPVSKYQNYAMAIGKTLWKFFMFLYHLHLAFHFGRSMIDMLDKPWARPSQKRQSKKYNVWVPRCCCPYSVSYNRCSYVPRYSNTLHYSCLLEHSWVFKTASNLNWCLKKTPEKTEQQLGCSTQTRNEREAMMNTWIVNVRRQHVSPVARTMLMDV